MPPSSPTPADIPDFRLLRPIGSGSYGEVWLAHSVIGAYRAIKIVRRDQFDSEKSFEREFRGIEAFEPVSRTHGNLLQVLHVGRNESAGFYFYVMELADDTSGSPISDPDAYVPKTLRSVVRPGDRLPVSEAIRIGRELAAGLSHLHGSGLVHRDIKPSNVVFVNGVAKLGDAGLVAHSREDMSLVGTEGYVPPEGMGRPQADLYSLGMVLYEISTGRCRHDFPEIPTDLPSREDKALFMKLNTVVLKACDPNSSLRFKTAGHLEAALDRIQPDANHRGEIHGPLNQRRLYWVATFAVILLLYLFFKSTSLVQDKQADQLTTPDPVAAPSLLSPAAKSINIPPSTEPMEESSQLLEYLSPDVLPNGNSLHKHNPVPFKTVTTENADEFLRP